MTGEDARPDPEPVGAGRTLPTDSTGFDIADVLAADLGDLGAELIAESGATDSMAMLRRDLRLAVRSLLGFSVTLTVPGPAVSVAINVVNEPLGPAQIGDVLAIQLPARHDTATASVTIYAAEPRAFDDLRDEFAYAFDRPLTVLTTPVPHPPVAPGITGLDTFTDVHQAVGVLLATGHTVETANIELIRRAHTNPGGMHAAAQDLIDTIESR